MKLRNVEKTEANTAVLTIEGEITGIETLADSENTVAPAYTLEGKRAPRSASGLKVQQGKVVLSK